MHGKVRGSWRGCDFGRRRTASQVANEKSIFQEWPFAGVSGSAALLVVKLVCLLRRASMHPMRDRTPPFASGTDDYLFNHLLIESFKVAANRPPPEPRTPDPAAPAFQAAMAAASSSSAAHRHTPLLFNYSYYRHRIMHRMAIAICHRHRHRRHHRHSHRG